MDDVSPVAGVLWRFILATYAAQVGKSLGVLVRHHRRRSRHLLVARRRSVSVGSEREDSLDEEEARPTEARAAAVAAVSRARAARRGKVDEDSVSEASVSLTRQRDHGGLPDPALDPTPRRPGLAVPPIRGMAAGSGSVSGSASQQASALPSRISSREVSMGSRDLSINRYLSLLARSAPARPPARL